MTNALFIEIEIHFTPSYNRQVTINYKPEYDSYQNAIMEQRKLCIQRARRVFENAINYYRTSALELKEERAILLEEWLNMESSFGELGDLESVRFKLPKKLKKRREIEIVDGSDGHEEYIDYLFPEESQASSLKILEQAYKWKKAKGGFR
ncbi:hypothetical protein HanRHA438_Chr01g0037061 [Helianthus annuus]|uniref:Uncharacterized protein n=1 Tax=Helianthus annuus TaxID=4232 RepID=A0A251VQT0_HELAN|nr:hypothetical protein HanXRQr2_Chr01g0036171 [Helianthus annuus]KAJ0612608.1 hypothetical protein HanHA300_Chr01g0029361 [Helianthus annuus]KAJ0624143.1 hypothetical protein HanIR_Chr01g0039991 [Helianthus annuus]KAJ0627969.1 hypothetical protein HanHA89_Chr01g0031671 [Helianthus annuus]KAJ0784258.1 hypothetical protein HanLR1_Chr01g0030171 [Helianthus annuus]